VCVLVADTLNTCCEKIIGSFVWCGLSEHLYKLNIRIMLSLYKTLVRPRVEYCASARSPYYTKDKESLEKVQRRFTKMIVNMDGL